MTDLQNKKKQLREMQMKFNIMKLETELLELDEKKKLLEGNIQKQVEDLEEFLNPTGEVKK